MFDTSNPCPATPTDNSRIPQLRRELRSWTRDLAVALGLALVIIIFLYQPVKVEGTSMAPLLSDQERIFINKFVYRFEPIERGDVVVFWYPLDKSKSFIKRVIGLPGETIELLQGLLHIEDKDHAVLEGPETIAGNPPAQDDSSQCGGRPANLHGDAQIPVQQPQRVFAVKRVARNGFGPRQRHRFGHRRRR